ncbi:MAG: hypothetical protein ACXW18_01235 [Pyrinomonadaceae bacterium]
MRRTIKTLALAALLAVFAVPALAQKQECNDENKAAWYKTFYDNFKLDAAQQKIAYDAANTYIASCPADPNDKQLPYMEKWVKKYKDVMDLAELTKKFDDAVKSKNPPQIISSGKALLATNPDNPAVNIFMGLAGLDNEAVLQDSAQAALKAISLVEADKPFAPLKSKEQALAYLNWVVGKSKLKSDPNAAIPYYIKAAKIEAEPKKNAGLYNELAAAYGGGPVAKLAEDYKVFIGKPESTESKLVKANLNQAIERQMDAFARAAALSTNPADKKGLMEAVTELYKSTHEGDPTAGVNELVAKVLSTPVPDVPTPITTLPATQSSTPATNGGPNGTTTGTAPATPATKKPPKNH